MDSGRDKLDRREGALQRSFKVLVSKWNETGWPIASLVLFLRPLHHWLTGHKAQIKEGQKVLEIGSGYPLYKLYADKVGKEGVFVAVDINENIQGKAKKFGYWLEHFLKKAESTNRVSHVTGDALRLPFGEGVFDTVIANNLTSDDVEKYIRETFRTLKPGGKAILAFAEFLSMPLVSAYEAKICRQEGFEDVNVQIGMPGSVVPGIAWNWYVEARKPEARTKQGGVS